MSYNCQCGRKFERKLSLTSHARFCKLYGKENFMSKHLTPNGYECECGRIFDNSQSLNGHFRFCRIHRNGIDPIISENVGGWNRGLTKKDHEGINKMAEKLRFKSRTWTEEQKSKLSKSLKGKTGGYREGSNKWRGCKEKQSDGKEVFLDSSYEEKFTNILDEFSIYWEKNYKKFQYVFDNKIKNYIPDFYLKDLDLWIEVKGWEKEIDKFKWSHFPYKIKIIRKDLLRQIEFLTKEALVAELVYAQD